MELEKEVLKQLDIRYLPLSEKESLTLRNINTKAEYCEYILENEIGN